jgi:hypothetical protein
MRIIIVCLFMCMLGVGCSLFRPEYCIGVRNSTKETIRDVDAKCDRFHTGGGIVVPTGFKLNLRQWDPIPQKALVKWRTSDGMLHEKEVEVRNQIPHKMKVDVIELVIDDQNNVQVKPFTKKEWKPHSKISP